MDIRDKMDIRDRDYQLCEIHSVVVSDLQRLDETVETKRCTNVTVTWSTWLRSRTLIGGHWANT